MRRILAMLLAVIMVLACMTSLTVSADGASVALDSTEVEVGATVTGTVTGSLYDADWVAISANADGSDYIPNNYQYIVGDTAEFELNAPASAGTYYVVLFENDGYDVVAASEPFTVTVTADPNFQTQAVLLSQFGPAEYAIQNEDQRSGAYLVTADNQDYLAWCNYVVGCLLKWDADEGAYIVSGTQGYGGASQTYEYAMNSLGSLDGAVPFAEMGYVCNNCYGADGFDFISNATAPCTNAGFWGQGYAFNNANGQKAYIYNVDFATGTVKTTGTYGEADFSTDSFILIGAPVEEAYPERSGDALATPNNLLAMNDRSSAWLSPVDTVYAVGNSDAGWGDNMSAVFLNWKHAYAGHDIFAVLDNSNSKTYAIGDTIELDVAPDGDLLYFDTCGANTRWNASLSEGDEGIGEQLAAGTYNVAMIDEDGVIVALNEITFVDQALAVDAARVSGAAITGTAAGVDVVELYKDGAVVATAEVADGVWSIATADLAYGVYTVKGYLDGWNNDAYAADVTVIYAAEAQAGLLSQFGPAEYAIQNEDQRSGAYLVTADDQDYLAWCNYVAGCLLKWDADEDAYIVSGTQGYGEGVDQQYGASMNSLGSLDGEVPFAEMGYVVNCCYGADNVDFISNATAPHTQNGFWGQLYLFTNANGQKAYIYNVDFATGTVKTTGTYGEADFSTDSFILIGAPVEEAYPERSGDALATPNDLLAMNDRSSASLTPVDTVYAVGNSDAGWGGNMSAVFINWKHAYAGHDIFAVLDNSKTYAIGDTIELDVAPDGDLIYFDTCGATIRWNASLSEGDEGIGEQLAAGTYNVAMIDEDGVIVALNEITFVDQALAVDAKVFKAGDAITGTAAGVDVVELYKDEAVVATAEVADGAWSIATADLEVGNYTVKGYLDGWNNDAYAADVAVAIELGEIETITVSDVTSNSAKLSWNAVAGATRYRIICNGETVKDTTLKSYTVKGLDPNTEYTYSVRPIADGKFIADAKSVTFKTEAEATFESFEATTIGSDYAVLSWSAIEGATKYRICVDGVGVKDTAATSVKLTGLAESTTYTYSIKAIKDGKYMDVTPATTSFETTAAISIEATVDRYAAGKALLTWTAVEGATKYRIATCKDGVWTAVKDTTGTTLKLTGLADNKGVQYGIRAIKDGKYLDAGYSVCEVIR